MDEYREDVMGEVEEAKPEPHPADPDSPLRKALVKAKDCLPQDAEEDRELIQALLDQGSEQYGSLVDECQFAIYG